MSRLRYAAWLALALLRAVSSVGAQRPSGSIAVDTALLEVRIGDAASGLVLAYRLGDSAVVPMREVMAVAGLDPRATGRELVSVHALATLLHADVVLDWSALVLIVADSGTLPVTRRAARERARAALRDRREVRIAAPLARASRTPSALTLDYSASRNGGIALYAGTRAMGGSFDASVEGLGTGRGVSGRRVAWESLASADESRRRWRIGTLDELGGRAGVRVTNAPLALADSIGVVDVAATGAPGSDVDAFIDGVLVATDTIGADGTVRVRVADEPGAHDVRVVTYAPDGNERVLARRRIVTPVELLPAHAFRYSVAATVCARCSVVAARASYAPIDRVTIAADVQPRTGRGSDALLSLDARLADALTLAVRREAATGTRVELRRDGAGGAGVALRSTVTLGGERATVLAGAWRLTRDALARAELVRSGQAWRAGASAIVATRIGTVAPSVTMVASPGGASRARWGADALLFGGWLPPATGSLRRAMLRLRAGSDAIDERELSAALVLPASPQLSIETSVAWRGDPPARRRILSLALRRRLSGATVRMAGERAGVVTSERGEASGSLVIDAVRGRAAVSADPLAGRAGVHGRVFVDRDGDGRYDAGDEPMAGVAIRVGGNAALTDADGGFVVWDLAPYRRVLVEVDPLSVDDDRLAAPPAVGVLPTPHALVWIDVPIRPRASAAIATGGGG